jgi:hypothetical protein
MLSDQQGGLIARRHENIILLLVKEALSCAVVIGPRPNHFWTLLLCKCVCQSVCREPIFSTPQSSSQREWREKFKCWPKIVQTLAKKCPTLPMPGKKLPSPVVAAVRAVGGHQKDRAQCSSTTRVG